MGYFIFLILRKNMFGPELCLVSMSGTQPLPLLYPPLIRCVLMRGETMAQDSTFIVITHRTGGLRRFFTLVSSVAGISTKSTRSIPELLCKPLHGHVLLLYFLFSLSIYLDRIKRNVVCKKKIFSESNIKGNLYIYT